MEGKLHEITIPTKKSEIFALGLLDYKILNRREIYTIASEKIETIFLTHTHWDHLSRPEVRKSWQSFANFSAPEDKFTIAKIRCLSSSGTYMRTLAEVIANKLSSQGLAFSIKRTKIGIYKKDQGWVKEF